MVVLDRFEARPVLIGRFMLSKPFGVWVRETRTAKGLGVRELARRMGVAHPTISDIENQKVGATRDMVRAIASALEVSSTVAVHAWLEDDAQEGGAITYITNRDAAIIAEAYEGMPPTVQKIVKGQVLSAAEIARDLEKELTIGGRRSDDIDNPSRQSED